MNNTPDDISIQPNTTAGHTTAFQDDGVKLVNEVRQTMLDASIATSKTDGNDISTFMSKPIPIISGTINSATTGIFQTVEITDQLLTNVLWYNKISGYNLLRGTAVIRLVLNAQPFQAGKVLMHYLPNARERIINGDLGYAQHNATLTGKTQQPSIEVDMRESAGEIRIPYIAPTLWFNRSLYESVVGNLLSFGWGEVYFSILSSLRSGASNTVDYTIYLSFEDFELAGPIYGPESGRQSNKRAVISREKKNYAKPSGVISGAIDKIHEPINYFNDGVAWFTDTVSRVGESVSSIANSFGGVGDAFADLFSVFGFSRPVDISTGMVVRLHNAFKSFNYNGVNQSNVLSLDSDNHVLHTDGIFGVDQDEMSFAYLKKVPAYLTSFIWNTSRADGFTLYTLDMRMSNFKSATYTVPSGISSYNMATYLPFSYISRYFQQYRGGLELTLKFVKTVFHSGRLQVEFTPSLYNIPTDLYSSSYVYREIIDIKDSTEIKLRLPYMYGVGYLNTGFYGDDAGIGKYNSFGTLKIRVLNPLVAASTVSTEMEVLVYFNAAEDFELAIPIKGSLAGENIVFGAEMNAEDNSLLESKDIGGLSVPQPTMAPVQTCVGELFCSIKQLLLLSRPCKMRMTLNDYTTPNNCIGYTFYPQNFCSPTSDTVSAGNLVKDGPISGSYLDEFHSGYAFSKGGFRYHIAGYKDNQAVIASLRNNIGARGNPFSDFTANDYCVPLNPSVSRPTFNGSTTLVPYEGRSQVGGCIDFIVPHYARTPIRCNYTTFEPDQVLPITPDISDYKLTVSLSGSAILNTDCSVLNFNLHKSAADDFEFGYFIGFNPVTVSSSL